MTPEPLHLSHRAHIMPASPIRKLVKYADEAKKHGIKVYHLNIGQPDIETPVEFFSAVRNYQEKVIAYQNSQGITSFIESLVRYYQRVFEKSTGNVHVTKENILVSTGGSEAITFAMMAVAEPDDEIIVFEPFYTNYNGFAIMAGITLVPIRTYPEDGYHLPSVEEIKQYITPRTRAILFCNPNNPTGTVLTIDELEMIKRLALEYNLFILSDEVYREFIYEGETKSILEFDGLDKHAILLDSLSKRYSICGARMGCAVSRNMELMEVMIRFGQARLCAATLEQIGSQVLVDEGDKYFKPMINEYRVRRDALYEELMKIPGVVCQRPNGAFYIMAKLPVNDIEQFAKWMLTDFNHENETTMIAPGPGFYATPGAGINEARFAYVLNANDCKRAIQIVARGIEKFNAR